MRWAILMSTRKISGTAEAVDSRQLSAVSFKTK
jgi:hypothetical protein